MSDDPRGLPGVDGHSIVALGDYLVLYGGKVSSVAFNPSVFSYNVTMQEWNRLDTMGEPPAARAYHTAVAYKNRMLVFGGLLAVGLDDVHFNNYNVFVNTDFLSSDDLKKRGKARMRDPDALPALTQQRKETYCFYELETSKDAVWGAPQTFGSIPPPRAHHSCVMGPGNKMMLYGGYSVHTTGRATDEEFKSLYSVYILNPETYAWTSVAPLESVAPMLWGHTACVTGEIVIVLGGIDSVNATETDAMCAYHIGKSEWRSGAVTSEAAPFPRACHTSVLFGNLMVVFGGMTEVNSRLFNDVHTVDLATGAWTRVQTKGDPPLPRSGHTAVVIGTSMYVIGGVDHNFHRAARVWSLDLKSFTWASVGSAFSTQNVTRLVEREEDIAVRLEDLKSLRRLQNERNKKIQELFKDVDPVILAKRLPPIPHSAMDAFHMRSCSYTPGMCYPLSLSHSVYSQKDNKNITPATQCASYLQGEIADALYHMPIEELPMLSEIMSPKPVKPIRPRPQTTVNPLSKYGFVDVMESVPDAPIWDNGNADSKNEMRKLCDDIRSTRHGLLLNIDRMEKTYNVGDVGLDGIRGGMDYEREITLRSDRMDTVMECGDEGLNPSHLTDYWRQELAALHAEKQTWMKNTTAAPRSFAVTDSPAIASAVKMRDDLFYTPTKTHFVSRSLQKLGLAHKLSKQPDSMVYPAMVEPSVMRGTLSNNLNYGPISSGERSQPSRPAKPAHGLVRAPAFYDESFGMGSGGGYEDPSRDGRTLSASQHYANLEGRGGGFSASPPRVMGVETMRPEL